MVIVNGLAISAFFIAQKYSTWAAILYGGLVSLIGIALVLSDHLEVFEVFKVGKLVTRAESNVEKIEQLRADIEKQVAQAQKDIERLRENETFSTLILKAQSGQRLALKELTEIAQQNTDLAPVAKEAVAEITTAYWLRLQNTEFRFDKEELGVPKDAGLSDYQALYANQDANTRVAIQDALLEGGVLPETMDYLVSLLDSESSVIGYLNLVMKLKEKVTVHTLGSSVGVF